MIAEPEIDLRYPLTDGDIAVNNLESARRAILEPILAGSATAGNC